MRALEILVVLLALAVGFAGCLGSDVAKTSVITDCSGTAETTGQGGGGGVGGPDGQGGAGAPGSGTAKGAGACTNKVVIGQSAPNPTTP